MPCCGAEREVRAGGGVGWQRLSSSPPSSGLGIGGRHVTAGLLRRAQSLSLAGGGGERCQAATTGRCRLLRSSAMGWTRGSGRGALCYYCVSLLSATCTADHTAIGSARRVCEGSLQRCRPILIYQPEHSCRLPGASHQGRSSYFTTGILPLIIIGPGDS